MASQAQLGVDGWLGVCFEERILSRGAAHAKTQRDETSTAAQESLPLSRRHGGWAPLGESLELRQTLKDVVS